MMTNTVRKFGVGVASAALVLSAGVPAFAADDAPRPLAGGWKRVASSVPGADRIDTAIAVADEAFLPPADAKLIPEAKSISDVKSVYVVNYMAPIDAATAGQLTDGPILLVNSDSRVIEQVKNQIKKYTSATTVYAVGGTKAVPDEVLKGVAGSKATARLGGTDRFETAIEVAKKVVKDDPSKAKTVLIAQSQIPVDALTAGTLDAGPVLLVDAAGQLPESAKKWLEENKPSKVIGLGGKKVVPDAALSEATLPGIIENPTAENDALRKALAAAKDARALYLGNNVFADSDTKHLSVEVAKNATPVTGTDPSKVDTVFAGQAGQWMGYKAQKELTDKLVDRTSAAVTFWKARFNDFLKDATTKTVADSNVQAKAKEVLGALYGLTFAPGSNVPEDAFTLDADSNVTGLAYDWAADQDSYKALMKAANKNIETYKNSKKDASEVLTDTLTSKAVPLNASTNSVTTLQKTTSPVAGGIAVAGLDAVAHALKAIADSNATVSESAMLAAFAALPQGTGYYRLSGADRYATAAQISNYWRNTKQGVFATREGLSKLTKVYLANGETMVDALVGGVLTQGPILLAAGDGKLTDATVAELKAIGANVRSFQSQDVPVVYAIGGTKAVADATAQAAADKIREGFKTLPEKDALAGLTLSATTATLTGKVTTAKTIDVLVNGQTPTGAVTATLISGGSSSDAPTVTYAAGKLSISSAATPKAGIFLYEITDGTNKVELRVEQKLNTFAATLEGPATADDDVTTGNDSNPVDYGTALKVKDAATNQYVTPDTLTLHALAAATDTVSNVAIAGGNMKVTLSGGKLQVTNTAAQADSSAHTQTVYIKATKAGYEDKIFTVTVSAKNGQSS